MKNKIIKSEHSLSASGEALIRVHNKSGKEVHNTGWKRNLMLYAALEDELSFTTATCTLRSHPSDSPIPNSQTLAGTFSQSGNIITTSGDVDFDNGDFRTGDNLLLGSGVRATITEIISSTQVRVYQSNSLTDLTATIFRSGITSSTYTSSSLGGNRETSLDTFNLSNLSDTFSTTGVADRIMQGTSDQFDEGVTVSVIYIASFARIVLAVPVEVLPGNTITVTYRYRRTMSQPSQFVDPDSPITGWPLQWSIDSISADGNDLTVVTTDEHYFEVGDSMIISNVAPQLQAFTSIVSDGTNWQIALSSHGFSVGDNITIQGTTSYNGNYIVAAVPDADSLTISNSSSNSTETTGSVRFATPADYFNGIFEISEVPDDRTIKLTSDLAASTPASGGGSISSENAQSTVNLWGRWNRRTVSGTIRLYADSEVIAANFPTYSEDSLNITDFTQLQSNYDNSTGATRANGFVEGMEFTTPTSLDNHIPRIKQLVIDFSSNSCSLAWTFDHIQSKPNTHDMTIRVDIRYEQDLVT